MKEGWKTTEFWIGLFGVMLVFLNDQFGWEFDTNTILAAVTMIVSYIASRTVLKVRNGVDKTKLGGLSGEKEKAIA
jgi:hypothetical protein